MWNVIFPATSSSSVLMPGLLRLKCNSTLIQAETERLLEEYIRGKMPTVQLFPIPDKSAPMLRDDCEAAGVEVENHKGKIQFHGLRNTCGSYLAARGVQANTIKDIMRHQDIRLTMDRYVRELDGATKQAVNKLPRFAKPKAKGKSA